ncbi:MAG: serine hydrolase [Lewinellaceae bacterium]|nr:serine hydrolase [Lewinellaceae bacterium]
MKPIRFLFLLVFFSLFLLGKTTAQDVDPKLAEALQNALDSTHQVLGIKGLGAALQLPDGAVWAGGSGVSSLSPPDSVGPEHAFAIASVTKTITAACILQLADEGTLALDDSLHQWLPAFPHVNPDITIRQLLRHQSGVYDILQNPGFQPQMLANVNRIWTLEEVIAEFIRPPAFQAGTRWGYSNTNYLLLGMVIEAATGNPYRQEFDQRFFTPLGLESFSLPAYDPLPEQVAHLWLDITGDGVVDDAHAFFSNWRSFFSATGPAGAYFATPADMARWMRACMSGSLYAPETWDAARQTVGTTMPGGSRYGLGLVERSYLGLASYGHGGDVSYSSSVVYFPGKDLSIAVHANDANINSWALASTVQALLKVYLDCEEAISNAGEAVFPVVSASVFPNPFFESITAAVKLPGTISHLDLALADGSGKAIRSARYQGLPAGEQQMTLSNLSGLAPGVYFLDVILDGERVRTFKIIKGK